MMEENRIEDVLSFPILLSERIRNSVSEAGTFQADCTELGKQADRLSQMLRSSVRLSTAAGAAFYDRPARRIAADLSKNLDRALTLVRKCKGRSVLRRVVTIVTQADFRKIQNLLESSIADMNWLLSIYDKDSIVLSLPPIASNDPILSWVWSFIASIHLGQLNDRIEAANELASLARDNDRNKKMIVEEGGVPPLLKLLKENSSQEAQIAAAIALFNLSDDQERVQLIVDELGIPIIVQILGDSPMRVQIRVANLVSRMAEHDNVAKEEFARENAIRPLVTLLSFEPFMDDPYQKPQSIHSIVQISKEKEMNSNHRSHLSQHRKEREKETVEVKHELKTSCAEALWKLAKGSVSNSRRITETKGLLCLAKLIEKEKGELQFNCLMALMEITAAAESNADLRRAAFKTNSPAAKAAVDQLLNIVNDSDNPSLQIAAIKSIGSLAHTFPARETRVISPLVKQLGHRNQDVATEATISLVKFACPENFLCMEHSKTVIEFNGVPPLMKLLRGGERTQLHGLVLLCYLAINVGNSEALEQARVLNALEGAERTVAAQYPELKELVSKAIYHLNLYHAGALPHRQSYNNIP
ncbi:hypothetical protein LOK49_LG03G00248 [Camellia lanceoleosa]|uniref:Uncharacterized protein n=1 Tax=Camellia lanceoleosa TaxID=1840588 RepID=A0ACC0IA53_9ERIC|nr:hypothetical protein LOK49_LG03G00248 [Camellia lanceoleosa]